MRITVRRRRMALRALVLALAVAAVPLTGLAQEKSPPAAQPGIQASIQKAVVATPAAPARVRATKTQAKDAAPGSGSFFKTPAGIAVLAVIGAGVGYAAYSASHDRVHSAVRAGEK